MPSPRSAAIRALCLAAIVLLSRAHASVNAGPASSLSEIPLPGGLKSALAVVDDRTAPDRALFLLEFIRRTHDTLLDAGTSPRAAHLRALLAHLDKKPEGADLLPLPLTPDIWIDAVFDGASTRETLAADILRSRNASLLYVGLMALDDETRAWLADERGLLSEIAVRHAAAFAAAAPGLRIAGGMARGPGGDDARPVWEALTGRQANRPVEFVRALVAERDGRLAYYTGALAQLDSGQLTAALRLDSAAPADRVAAGRRLLTLFEQVAPGWRIAERAFWRPALDPALFIADLPRAPDGRPIVRGSRAFWQSALAQGESALAGAANLAADDEPADVLWLCERVFEQPADHRRRYQIALAGTRFLEAAGGQPTSDTIAAVRASVALPALSSTIERAGIYDAAVIAAAVRRAEGLLDVSDLGDAARALAQYQGVLAVVARAVMRGSLTSAQAADAIRQLSAIDPGPRGHYNGGIAKWLPAWARTHGTDSQGGALGSGGPSDAVENGSHDDAAALERTLLRLVAGPSPRVPLTIDWEGTRYRVDLAAGEIARLSRFLGEYPRPYLSSAEQLAMAADVLGETPLHANTLQQLKANVDAAATEVLLTDEHAWQDPRIPARYRDAAAQLERVSPSNAANTASRAASALRTLADDLVAVALTELTYALAMGHADSIPISIDEAASRHNFGLAVSGARRRTAWQLGVSGSDGRRGWHVTGSLLGLDVRLAEFALRRLSNLPPRRPTLNDEDRRVFIETTAVINPAALHDDEAAFILAALQRGRERVAAAGTPAGVAALADALPLDPARRTLLLWSAAHDPERVAPAFSPLELLWLGTDQASPSPRLHAWGVSADARNGCLCPQMIDRRPWDSLAGRWTWGTMASGFPDLNLRLTEMLAEMKMPIVLVGPVLKAATLELVNNAASRDPDDRRALVEFVQSLTPVHVADFLAVLTTDGPLVPMDDMTPTSGGYR